jgi:hypothetical protein
MKTRHPIPTAKILHGLFIYKNGKLYWKHKAILGRMKAGERAGYVNSDGYRKVGINGISYHEHRLVWRMHHPKGKMPFVLDHIDGERANNRIENLRSVTLSENQQNRHTRPKPKIQKTNKLLAYV